jgi:hypothetical protein
MREHLRLSRTAWLEFDHQHSVAWIWPSAQRGLNLTISTAWLECDHQHSVAWIWPSAQRGLNLTISTAWLEFDQLCDTYMSAEYFSPSKTWKVLYMYYTYIHAHVHAYIYTYMSAEYFTASKTLEVCTHVLYTHAYIHIFTLSCNHTCIHTYIHTYTHTYFTRTFGRGQLAQYELASEFVAQESDTGSRAMSMSGSACDDHEWLRACELYIIHVYIEYLCVNVHTHTYIDAYMLIFARYTLDLHKRSMHAYIFCGLPTWKALVIV